jgi:hypothetical protein
MQSSTSKFKNTAPFLVVFWILSLFAFAVDQHDNGSFQYCPICYAEQNLNGEQNFITTSFHPIIAYHDSVEKLLGITIPILLPFENKASPE